MSKKEKMQLSTTKVETAEERLEELVKNKSITDFKVIFNNYSSYNVSVQDGDCRIYPDGFETIEPYDSQQGVLYLGRRGTLVFYDSKKEWEKQNTKV